MNRCCGRGREHVQVEMQLRQPAARSHFVRRRHRFRGWRGRGGRWRVRLVGRFRDRRVDDGAGANRILAHDGRRTGAHCCRAVGHVGSRPGDPPPISAASGLRPGSTGAARCSSGGGDIGAAGACVTGASIGFAADPCRAAARLPRHRWAQSKQSLSSALRRVLSSFCARRSSSTPTATRFTTSSATAAVAQTFDLGLRCDDGDLGEARSGVPLAFVLGLAQCVEDERHGQPPTRTALPPSVGEPVGFSDGVEHDLGVHARNAVGVEAMLALEVLHEPREVLVVDVALRRRRAVPVPRAGCRAASSRRRRACRARAPSPLRVAGARAAGNRRTSSGRSRRSSTSCVFPAEFDGARPRRSAPTSRTWCVRPMSSVSVRIAGRFSVRSCAHEPFWNRHSRPCADAWSQPRPRRAHRRCSSAQRACRAPPRSSCRSRAARAAGRRSGAGGAAGCAGRGGDAVESPVAAVAGTQVSMATTSRRRGRRCTVGQQRPRAEADERKRGGDCAPAVAHCSHGAASAGRRLRQLPGE